MIDFKNWDIDFFKKSWHELLRLEIKDVLLNELKRIFKEEFVVDHELVDNSKTEVKVRAIPLMRYFIEIKLFNKEGQPILDTKHIYSGGLGAIVELKRTFEGWHLHYDRLFIKPEFQQQGLSAALLEAGNRTAKRLDKANEFSIDATSVGKYSWSRLEGVKFKNKQTHKLVDKGFKKWCKENGIDYKYIEEPKDYPKEYLLSELTPEFIEYIAPIP